MRLTATTVEISGGEVSDLMAHYLQKEREGSSREFRGHANHAPLEMDPSQ